VVGYPIDGEGIWCQVFAHQPSSGGAAALFLDRDGVIVEEVEYLHRVEDIVLIEGAATVTAAANRRNVPVVLVSNQSGVGRGYYGWTEFAAVQQAMVSALAAQGARIDAVYACPYHVDGHSPYGHPDHPARKPNPGMLLRAARALALDLGRSWLVGDKATDIEAARCAGLAGALQVETGHGRREREAAAALARPGFEVRFGRSIAATLDLPILQPQPQAKLARSAEEFSPIRRANGR